MMRFESRSDRRAARRIGRRAIPGRALPALLGSLLLGGCLEPPVEEATLRRGDVAFAAGETEEALAEY
ncbi:MAG: hypothetical protein RQ751_04425, partial [Longimicrobiales bacterium]|nr:hypothetical protein [Longimicrobiales bacterium]